MKKFNTWHQDQEKTKNNTFKPGWNKDIILSIIDDINRMVDFVDIQFKLVKENKISPASASLWIKMSRRIMTDMQNGLNIDESLERDRERRNLMRRKTKVATR